VKFSHKSGGSKQEETLSLEDFIDVKGWKALGNKVGEYKVLKIEHTNPPKMEPAAKVEEKKEESDLFSQQEPKEVQNPETKDNSSNHKDDGSNDAEDDGLKAGDIIDLDL